MFDEQSSLKSVSLDIKSKFHHADMDRLRSLSVINSPVFTRSDITCVLLARFHSIFFQTTIRISFDLRWSPESEKGTFVSFSYLGGTFGSVITFPLCGKDMKLYHIMINHFISYDIISYNKPNHVFDAACQAS